MGRTHLALALGLVLFAAAPRATAATTILITNDDGPAGPGLQALVTAIKSIPNTDVQVVVPSGNASGGGAGITVNSTFAVATGVPLLGGVDTATTISSLKPADCVRWATQEIYGGTPPDYVLSGINQGQNVGAAFGSGTVGGASQGNAFRARAIAFSQALSFTPPVIVAGSQLADYTSGAAFAHNLVAALIAGDPSVRVLDHDFRRGAMLNVQIPAGAPTGVRLVKVADTFDIFGPSLIHYGDQGGGTWLASVDISLVSSHGAAYAAHPLTDDVGPLARDEIVVARWYPLKLARGGGRCCGSLVP